MVAASSIAIPVENPPIAFQSIEGALQKGAPPIASVESEEACIGHIDKPVSGERPTSKIRPTQNPSTNNLEYTVRKEITGIPVLVGHAVGRLFCVVGREA